MITPQQRTSDPSALDVPRDGVTVVRRLPRSVLLLGVLLFLFMPFLTVSCSSPLGGSVGVEFTGWDSTLGTAPSMRGAEGLNTTSRGSTDTVDEEPSLWLLHTIAVVLGGGFLAVVLAGSALLMLLRSSTARSIVAAAGAALAAALITANHIALRAYVDGSLDNADAPSSSANPTFPGVAMGQFFDVHTRSGLTVTLTYLILLALANIARLAFRAYSANTLASPIEVRQTSPSRSAVVKFEVTGIAS